MTLVWSVSKSKFIDTELLLKLLRRSTSSSNSRFFMKPTTSPYTTSQMLKRVVYRQTVLGRTMDMTAESLFGCGGAYIFLNKK